MAIPTPQEQHIVYCLENEIDSMVSTIIEQCSGDISRTLDIDFDNGFVAEVAYEVEFREIIGGSYEGYDFERIATVDYERYFVRHVWDEEGNECPTIVLKLNKILNS